MRFARKKGSSPNVGSIDGGEGRGVPLPEDEEEAVVDDDRDAFAVLDDEDDASPGDRRRDPLRRQ
jgi:hypothetical protein